MCFFLLVKAGELQLILASAVIPMPGACVFPTTTSRSSAVPAADGSGRCSARAATEEILKENPDLQVKLRRHTHGCLPALFTASVAVLRAVTVTGKLAVRFQRSEVGKCGWGCLPPFAL